MTPAPVRLSFCIPTLGRPVELRASLESIVSQAGDRAEIVIVDGGDVAATERVVADLRGRTPSIRIVPSVARAGVDRDILLAVAEATGSHCWLFSDDDILLPGALDGVLEALARQPDVSGVSLDYQAFDATLTYTIATAPAVRGGRRRTSHLFTDRASAFAALAIHLGFISCQVVRRDRWQAALADVDLDRACNAWIIIAMAGAMMGRDPRWYYLHEQCVGYRSGNDSLIARVGVLRRQEVTHVAFADTIGAIFPPGSPPYRAVMAILIEDRMPRTLAFLKARGLPLGVQWAMLRLYLTRYVSYPQFWLRVAPLFLVPNVVLRGVERLYRWWRKRGRLSS